MTCILWIFLGVLLTATAGHSGSGLRVPPVYLLVVLPAYLFIMIRFVRPVLGNMVAARMHNSTINTRSLVLVGAATFASALATELMGLHYIIGAFLIGAVMPVNLRAPILDRLQVMSVALLMPFFFTLTGMRTLIDLNSTALFEVLVVTTRSRCDRHPRRNGGGRPPSRGEMVDCARPWMACCNPRA